MLTFINRRGQDILLWALCTVCVSAAVCIYMGTVLNIYTVIGAVLTAAMIPFLDFAKSRKKLGGLLYAAVLICVSLIPSMLIRGRDDIFGFVRWFFSGSEAVETQTNFILTLTLVMTFLFTSAAYYFTKLIYRSSVMTLLSLIPFALAVKTVTSLPWGYAALTAALNFIIFVYNARQDVLEGAKPRGNAALMVYSDFAVAVVLLALILPKPSETPYYEKFEKFANTFQFGGTGENQYTGEYDEISGTADELRRGESVLIYYVSTEQPSYMKTQVFDLYDAERRGWIAAEEMTGSKTWQEHAPYLSYEKLGNAVASLDDTEKIFSIYPMAEQLDELTERESYSLIYTRSFPAVYILAPQRAVGVNLSGINPKYSARTDSGEIFTNIRLLPADANYAVRYYTEDMQDMLIEKGYCDISFEDYGRFIQEAYLQSEADSEAEKTLSEFQNMHLHAEEYRETTETKVSAEIQSLADELTAGMEYDWQKAYAIEAYFQNGFLYDLNYEPPEDSDTPEYFLFESKRGICSDFATAYSLLARAAGLTVRYTEGFVMQKAEDMESGYYIYTDNAHAYPEVYIPGAGWKIFEPTPGDLTSRGGQGSDDEQAAIDPLTGIFTAIIAVFVLGILILVVIFAPKFMECIFRIRVKFAANDKAVNMLYKRHVSAVEQKYGETCSALTPEQLGEYTESRTGISLDPITEPFKRSCYGGLEVTAEERSAAYGCYIMQYKEIHKRKKERK